MFDLLPAEYKSLAVRMRVKYMPHPYIAIGTAKSRPTGLGMESDGLEVPFEDLPPWEEKHVKTFPVCWKNPVTGNLHVQVHPSGIHELVRPRRRHAPSLRTTERSSPSPVQQLIDALPPTATRTESTLFPDGAHITDLKEARDLLYKLQRPGIAPEHVYVVDWKPRQLALFHNRGCLHSITGAFAVRFVRMLSVPGQERDVNLSFPIRSLTRSARCMFPASLSRSPDAGLTSSLSHSWQCNLASTDSPAGPTQEDLQLYA